MIQIYRADNSDYSMNGDSVINPTKCILEADITGNWIVSMIHPLDDKTELITENAVICADTFIGKNQLFRIYDIEKDDENITCSAYPIFLALLCCIGGGYFLIQKMTAFYLMLDQLIKMGRRH